METKAKQTWLINELLHKAIKKPGKSHKYRKKKHISLQALSVNLSNGLYLKCIYNAVRKLN